MARGEIIIIQPQVIVLAPHNLATIVNASGHPAILGGVDLIPASSVLYNFEHVPMDLEHINDDGTGRNSRGTFISPNVIEIYRRFVVSSPLCLGPLFLHFFNFSVFLFLRCGTSAPRTCGPS